MQLADSILDYISRTRFSSNIGFVQEHSKYRNFHYGTNSVKINNQIVKINNQIFKLKKKKQTNFGPFSQFFG